MGYVNTTAAQAARVFGGWLLGMGIAFVALTMGEFSTPQALSFGAWLAIALATVGGLAFGLGTWRTRYAQQQNNRFFALERGTAILKQRRDTERVAVRLRQSLLALFLIVGTTFIVLAGTLRCVEDVCTGFLTDHERWLGHARAIAVLFGFALLAATVLARVLALETDRLEFLAGEAERHRDDGPTPGLRRSRWE